MKRTPGISNPVDPRRAEVDRVADADHAKAGAQYVQILESRARARSFMAKVRAKLGMR